MSRVVVIGFDSPLLSQFEHQLEAGELPAVRSVLDRGRMDYLREGQDRLPSIAWPTLVASAPVTEHELLYAQQLVPGTYRTAPTRAEDSLVPPFWSHLDGTGLKLSLLSMYGGAVQPQIEGTQIAGWCTHDPYNRNGPFSSPSSAASELIDRFGKGLSFHGIKVPSTLAEYETFAELVRKSAQQYADAATHLADSSNWDLLVLGYNQPHEAGHFLAHLSDPTHPGYIAEASDRAKSTLADVNRIVDRGIGSILEHHPDASVIIATPYTLGLQPHLDQVPRRVLERAGMLSHARAGDETIDLKTRALRAGRSMVRQVVPARFRPALGKLVPRDQWIGQLDLASIDWAATKAFDVPEDGSSALRFNLSGREPHGIVRPGSEYQQLADDLRQVFGELRDADTGRPVVRALATFEEVFGYPPPGSCPDFLVDWERTHPVRAVQSDALGMIEVPRDDRQSATHDAPGFAIYGGESVEARPGKGQRGITDVGKMALEMLAIGASGS